MIGRLALALYIWALRTIGLFERRCGWCKKFGGWKYGGRAARITTVGYTTHGICRPCQIKFEADGDRAMALRAQQEQQRRRAARRQNRVRRSTLRRRTGGWSGAVASCGRVA